MPKNIAYAIQPNNSARSFHACVAIAMVTGMKATQEIRRDNLRALLSRYASQRELADELSLAPAYINQMFNGYRGIGERTARKIEKQLGLPHLWMDRPPRSVDEDRPPAPVLPPASTPDPPPRTEGAREQLLAIMREYEEGMIADDDVAALRQMSIRLVVARRPRKSTVSHAAKRPPIATPMTTSKSIDTEAP